MTEMLFWNTSKIVGCDDFALRVTFGTMAANDELTCFMIVII